MPSVRPNPPKGVKTFVPIPRRPWLAVLLSLVAPGLGHLYAGRVKVALAFALAVQIGAWLALSLWIFLPPSAFTVVLGHLVLLGVFLGTAAHAGVLASKAGSTYQLGPYNRWYSYLAAFVALALWQQASFSVAKNNLAQAFRIPSPPMEPTMLVGDFVWVAKLPPSLRTPENGAIMVFVSVEDSTPGLHLAKRVIGMPGDTLRMVRDTVYRNGLRLDEPYTTHSSTGVIDAPEHLRLIRTWQLDHYVGPDLTRYQPTTHDWGPVVVPRGAFFAIGDNRDQSYDSRYYGFVPFDHIRGRPRLVYFSYDPQARAIRWKRIGQAIP